MTAAPRLGAFEHHSPLDAETAAYVRLMQSVVAQALQDATHAPGKVRQAHNYRVDRERYAVADERVALATHQARNWLMNAGPDFRLVCQLGLLDPEYISRKAAELAAKGWPRFVAAKVHKGRKGS